ncbi:MAG TPA: response regulator [Spirochaetota bacterium]|nr:response regulator [Spirochaetota bacterium]HPC41425.1 response regulator [Spirochaetota bacterium]HPL17069.1 response regulator [Spirochaetota bacterium]HQF09193.1 response regulator [Spirochaetota bacterium]HQH97734.1 response regulator [Spirochaetota bacterium]
MPEKQTIIIIEDEPGIADTVTYALSREGFDAVWAATGAEGMELLERGGIDLAILDIGLPDISGFDLARTIRKRSDVPLRMLTARSDEIDRVLGLELGADDCIVKPFSPRELVARVRAVLRRSGGTPADSGGNAFAIDADRRRITYRGSILDLSRY